MRYEVLTPFTVKTATRNIDLTPGQVISLRNDKASILIEAGKLLLIQDTLDENTRDTYEERAAIMEYDGGLSRVEAERLSWCNHACMLNFPSQWQTCERFAPHTCLKLINKAEVKLSPATDNQLTKITAERR